MTGKRTRLSFRERIFKLLFVAGDKYKSMLRWLEDLCRFVLVISISLFLIGFLLYVGFIVSEESLTGIRAAFRILFVLIYFAKYIPELLALRRIFNGSPVFRAIVFLLCTAVFIANFITPEKPSSIWTHFHGTVPIIIALFLMTILKMSKLLRRISTVKIQPAPLDQALICIEQLDAAGLLQL